MLCTLAAVAIPAPGLAGPISYLISSGNRAATADFERSGSNLIVTLTNTSLADALVPTDILTGIFFEISGDPALTRVSAVLAPGSSVLIGGTGDDVTPSDDVVGGEWAYQNNLDSVPMSNGGVSSVGLGVFGSGDRFPGDNLQGPTSPDGLQFGITSAADNLLTGNGGLSGNDLILNSVVFTLGGFTGEPDALITDVEFQYGTDLSEPRVVGQVVPEPGTLGLAAVAIISLTICGWRRRKGNAARSRQS